MNHIFTHVFKQCRELLISNALMLTFHIVSQQKKIDGIQWAARSECTEIIFVRSKKRCCQTSYEWQKGTKYVVKSTAILV